MIHFIWLVAILVLNIANVINKIIMTMWSLLTNKYCGLSQLELHQYNWLITVIVFPIKEKIIKIGVEVR